MNEKISTKAASYGRWKDYDEVEEDMMMKLKRLRGLGLEKKEENRHLWGLVARRDQGLQKRG